MPGPPDFCPYGCYWECEHRAAATPGGPKGLDAPKDLDRPRALDPSRAGPSRAGPPGTGLFPVEDTQGRALQRCRDCGDFFASALDHARDHEQLRQLGHIPDDPLPQPWSDGQPWGDGQRWSDRQPWGEDGPWDAGAGWREPRGGGRPRARRHRSRRR